MNSYSQNTYCLFGREKKTPIKNMNGYGLDIYIISLQNSPYSTRLTQYKNTDNWINWKRAIGC